MTESGKVLFFSPPHAISPSSPIEGSPIMPATAVDTLAAPIRIIEECGQDPVTQLAGYLITEDPTYLPEYFHARGLADRIGRDKLLETLIELYMADHPSDAPSSRL